ncbi:MAG: efflux RND transporter permease subunit [bacterium]|nr:efflux RND transporter permease subunit [bacterium]
MTVTEIAIKRPAAMSMFFTALVILGIISYTRLPVDLLPSMNWPWVTVVTLWPGAGPKEVESMVAKPLEDAVISLNKLKHIRSYNMENYSVMVLEFEMSADADVVLQDVQRAVSATRAQLPNDVEEPQIFSADLGTLPIIRAAVASSMRPTDLFTLLNEKVKPRLQQVEGVGQVNITGGEEREIHIVIDPDKAQVHGLTINEVNRIISADNLDVPAGKMYGGQQDYVVRMAGKFRSVNEIQNIQIPLPSGVSIQLREIAQVVDTIKTDRSLLRLNGKSAIGIQIVKQAQANSVKTSERVRKELKKIEKDFQDQLQIEIAQDITTFTKESVKNVQTNVVEALFTVSLVLLIFLHSLRNSFIVLIAIPISLISTFLAMAFFGFSVNLMTMMAMGMVVGVLVDDSIVVLENIHRWLHKGADPVTAAIRGRNEIGLAAVSITLVDVVVFLPVGLLTGLVGNIFREFSLVFVSSVLMSLFVSFTVTPLLASRLNTTENIEGEKWMAAFKKQFDIAYQKLVDFYKKLLNWSLTHRFRVILLTTALMLGALSLVPLGFVGSDFIPYTDRGEFTVFTKMPLGSSLEVSNQAMHQIESYILKLPEVDRVLSSVGLQETEMGLNYETRKGSIQVKLIDAKKRKRSTIEIQNEIAKFAKTIPGMDVVINDIGIFGTANSAPFQFEIRGQDLDSTQVAVMKTLEILRNLPGTRDVQSSFEIGAPELQILLDRKKAANSFITPAEVAMAVRSAINGTVVTRFRTGESEVDIRTLISDEYRKDPSKIGQIELKNALGQIVKLEDVATIERTSGPSSIQRKDRQRFVTVSANIVGRSLGEVTKSFEDELAKYKPPEGVTFQVFGDIENMRTMINDILQAIVLSVIFVYMILVALYESYVHPFTVMFSVPVSLIGALGALALTGKTLSMFSMIGILILMGLVTKNGILIVDFTNQLRKTGLDVKNALLEAGPLRLRPILMTTLTMVVGLLPLALGFGAGGEMRSGMGIVIIGGLLSSLFLSLVLVPVMYSLLDRFTKLSKSKENQALQPQNT